MMHTGGVCVCVYVCVCMWGGGGGTFLLFDTALPNQSPIIQYAIKDSRRLYLSTGTPLITCTPYGTLSMH